MERVPDHIDDATHIRLDKLVLEILDDETYSAVVPPVLLLTTIVQTWEERLDPRYGNMSQANALLREHPALINELQKAWDQKSFKDIRNLRTSCVILSWQIGSNVDTEILQLPAALGVVALRRHSATANPPLFARPDPMSFLAGERYVSFCRQCRRTHVVYFSRSVMFSMIE